MHHRAQMFPIYRSENGGSGKWPRAWGLSSQLHPTLNFVRVSVTATIVGCWGRHLGFITWLQGEASVLYLLRPPGGVREAGSPGVAVVGQQRASVPRVTPSRPSSSMRRLSFQRLSQARFCLEHRGRVPWRLALGGAGPLGSSPTAGRLPRGWHTAAWRPWPLSLFSKKGEEFVGSGGGLFIEDAGNPQRTRASPSGGGYDRALGPFPTGSTAWGLGARIRLAPQGTRTIPP